MQISSLLVKTILLAASLAQSQGVFCPAEQNEVSVEGVEGVFCVKGQLCMADVKEGVCPSPQEGLPNGSHCGVVASGVYGCKPNPTLPVATKMESVPTGCAADEQEVSVEGMFGVFCVKDTPCSGSNNAGACPEAQVGLDFGSYCGLVRTGVFGCLPNTEGNPVTHPEYENPCADSLYGNATVSVVGLGTFCASEPVCSGNILGNCPSMQDGLEWDSVCDVVSTGVYGCVPGGESADFSVDLTEN